MKILGIVQWTNRDKNGTPIAGVRPIEEVGKDVWRSIDAKDEFPEQGQVFWPNAQAAVEGALVFFRPEPNPGFKDEFRLVEPKLAHEVIDLRRVGTEDKVRSALSAGLSVPGPVGNFRALIWCQPDMLVGPVELRRSIVGTATLVTINLHRVPCFEGAKIKAVRIDEGVRLLRLDDSGPSGHIDWDDDAVVLRRAVEFAVREAKHSGYETNYTKKQIEETVRLLSLSDAACDAPLEKQRLARAISTLNRNKSLLTEASELAERLLEYPSVKKSMEERGERYRTQIQADVRNEIEKHLEREFSRLAEASANVKEVEILVESKKSELASAESRLASIEAEIEADIARAEAHIENRLADALARPYEVLGEVGLLRPFLAQPVITVEPIGNRFRWPEANADALSDQASIRRALTVAARAVGVSPSTLLQLHAASIAGLMPITFGPGAVAALKSYAYAICGARFHIEHMPPSAIQPSDLDKFPNGGVGDAWANANAIDGLSLYVLEGANRSALEACLIPVLKDAELDGGLKAKHSGFRVGATLIAGATTVPVTSEIWSHGVAIYVDQTEPSGQRVTIGNVPLANEFLHPGNEPTHVVDELLEKWPACDEIRRPIRRFACGLARVFDDPAKIQSAVRSALLLPYLMTALTSEEQSEAFRTAGDTEKSLSSELQQLRRRLA